MKRHLLITFLLFNLSIGLAQTEFITTWKTDNIGTSADNQITIPTFSGETYSYNVDWGDGTSDTNITGDITHTYTTAGTYLVSITGQFPRIYFNRNFGDKDKITEINQWGAIEWSSMGDAFNGCSNLNLTATDTPNLSSVRDMIEMFRNCTSLVGNSSINEWNVSNVKIMNALFAGAINFNESIQNWNVSGVEEMNFMFEGATIFNQPLNDWDVSNVLSMTYMFANASSFNQSLNNWNVSNVESMILMFSGASLFNSNIDDWSVNQVKNMRGMFYNCNSFNQDIGNWDVSNVTNMSLLFDGAVDFNQDLSNWNVSNVTTMENMFSNNTISTENYDKILNTWSSLPSLQNNVIFDGGLSQYCNGIVGRLKLINENGWTITDSGKALASLCTRPFITTWKTDNPGLSDDNQITISTFPGLGYNYSIEWGDGTTDSNITGNITHTYTNIGTYQISITGTFPSIFFGYELNNPSFDNPKLISVNQWGSIEWETMDHAFLLCSNMDVLALDTPDLSQVTDLNRMFWGCSSLTNNRAMNLWDLQNITTMSGTFGNTDLFNADIGNWNVENVVNLNGMFADATAFNKNIDNWNVSNVTNISVLFSGASSYNQPLNNWDVSNVINFSSVFSRTPFNQPLNNWNTGNGTNMSGMFGGATEFNQDIGGWNTSKVERISSMFQQAESFNQDIGDWDTTNMFDMIGVFEDAHSFNQDIGSWDVSNVTNMLAMFSRATDFNQDLSNWNVSNVTNMARMFGETENFNQPINNWDVSKVINMSEMFYEAKAFNKPLSNWNVALVTNMDLMFYQANSFNQNLGGWNVSNVTNMTGILIDAPLSVRNFDKTLIGWASLPSLQNSVEFNAGFSKYCIGEASKNEIIATYEWSFIDGGKEEGSCEDLVPFITTWKTDNPGVSENNQITIPTFSGEIYDYTVEWGDGTSDIGVTGNITHTYSTSGTYQVLIKGDFPRIFFNNEGDINKLLSIDQWGYISWNSMDSAFWGCQNLDVIAEDIPDFSNMTSMRLMFRNCESLIGNSIGNWDVSSIIDFNNLFSSTDVFNQDLNDWNVSNAENMNAMFDTAITFNGNISSWNVSNVVFMSNMFSQAHSFNQDVSAWDVSKVLNFTDMFNSATVFNQDVSNWNVGNGRILAGMFASTDFFNQDISNWDLSNAENIAAMFFQARQFNQEIGDWNVLKVTNMSGLFSRAETFNSDISNWDVSNVTNMIAMFSGATAFDQNLGAWNVTNVSDLTDMFFGSGLSNANYDTTLNGWAILPSLQNNVVFDAGNSQFCEAADARQFIIDTYGWTITDGGEVPFCNEDNDTDGVLDHLDSCLNTRDGVTVNENGCEIIPSNAISVYTETPTCVGEANGSLEVSSSLTGLNFTISLEGNGFSETYTDITLEENLKVENLASGGYTVTISIPEVFFEQVYGVTINEIDSVSGKRESVDTKGRTVTYSVSGSYNYTVDLNGVSKTYVFNNTGNNIIQITNLKDYNTVLISGESDCQGKINDSFAIVDSLLLYPTVTANKVSVAGVDNISFIKVYDSSGRLVMEKTISKNDNTIDLSAFKSGIYPVQVTTENKTNNFKIIKK